MAEGAQKTVFVVGRSAGEGFEHRPLKRTPVFSRFWFARYSFAYGWKRLVYDSSSYRRSFLSLFPVPFTSYPVPFPPRPPSPGTPAGPCYGTTRSFLYPSPCSSLSPSGRRSTSRRQWHLRGSTPFLHCPFTSPSKTEKSPRRARTPTTSPRGLVWNAAQPTRTQWVLS